MDTVNIPTPAERKSEIDQSLVKLSFGKAKAREAGKADLFYALDSQSDALKRELAVLNSVNC